PLTPSNPCPLIRLRFIWLHDSNSMIRKPVVCTGQLEFWHMAGHTLVFGDRAGLRARFPAAMTGRALRVVVDRFVAHLVVRVVAREAAKSCVIRILRLT